MSIVEPPVAEKHALWEDVLAIPSGAFMLSFGVFLLGQIGGVAGGLAGVAILGSYWTHWSFGLIFFVINVPFFILAVWRMGVRFTVKTVIAVALISVFSWVHEQFLDISSISPLYGGIFAGLCVGVGMIMIFRHGASAGGFGILALYLQESRGIRAGYAQGAFDVVVVILSLTIVPPYVLFCSLLGAVILNLILAINHRPGRYLG